MPVRSESTVPSIDGATTDSTPMRTPSSIASPSPPRAIGSVIVSMAMLALCNGLMVAFIPIRLTETGYASWIAGATVSAMGSGGLLACLVTGRVVRRVNHARAFSTMIAFVILSVLMIAMGTYPYVWMAARAVYGFAATSLFIISQSWLNDACVNAWRGKVIALFYMSYVVSIGAGGLLLRYVSTDGTAIPMLAILFATLAILPVSLTRLQTPPPPASISIAVRAVWKISPVGLIGLLAAGGLTMLLYGFSPIYLANEGYSREAIGLLLFLMQLGLIAVQYPLGALSDRMDRRYTLIGACLLVVFASLLAALVDVERFWLVVLVFAVWAGATESIYSIANAYANDRAEPDFYVALSSTLLIAWSLSGLVLPAATTALMPVFGTRTFIYLIAGVATLYAGFVIHRLHRRDPVPVDQTEPYQQVSGQLPLSPEFAPAQDE